MRPVTPAEDSEPSPQLGFPSYARPTIDVAAISDIGLCRTNNEDCFGYDLESGLFVVCDGVGGHSAGEVASRLAVDELLLQYDRLRSNDQPSDEAFFQSILHGNRMVWAAAQEHRDLRGMGTTLVAACLRNTRLLIANVGDSRAYFLRGEQCVQITQDHVTEVDPARNDATHPIDSDPFSAGQPDLSRSNPNQKDALVSPFITRALGAAQEVQPDLFTADLQPDDTVLLTTDGLTRYADAGEIAHSILNSSSLATACRNLLEIALRHGAEDNVTCLLLRMLPG